MLRESSFYLAFFLISSFFSLKLIVVVMASHEIRVTGFTATRSEYWALLSRHRVRGIGSKNNFVFCDGFVLKESYR